jgi:Gpi18-like mannosyltransferase
MKFDTQERDLSLIALISIFWTFALAYAAYVVFEDRHPASVISIWNVWDTQHYLKIAEYGYSSLTEDNKHLLIVFFPLYPYTIKLFALVFRDYLLSALIVSNLAYVVSAIYLYRLASIDLEDESALRSAVYMSVFPTAIFLHAAYTESLFLALSIACFYYGRKERWAAAGIIGMLAAATRITGILLLPALAIEYIHQKGFKIKEVRKNILWLSVIALGLIFYLGINFVTFGEPFKFLEIQNQHWFKHLDFPHEGFLSAFLSTYWREPREGVISGIAEAASGLIGLAIIVYSFFRLRLSYCLYALAAFLLVTSTSYWLSVPRYLLSVFPIFMTLALIGSRRPVNYLIIFASLTLYTLLLIQFIRFSWAF